MTKPAAKRRPSAAVVAALAAAAGGLAVFHFFGNATRGYIDTASLFRWWVSQWLDPRAETEHGWLVLGLSAFLLWRNLRTGERSMAERGLRMADRTIRGGGRRAAPAPRSAIRPPPWVAPLVAMFSGLALHAVGFVAQQTRVSIVALLVFTWGVLRLSGGRRWGAAAVFPLGFLMFAIPVSMLDEVGLPLRLWVTRAGETIAHAAGIDVLRSGTQLVAPDGRFHYDVAAPCSGVRSLVALTALAVLLAYLNFGTWSRRWLVVALALPLVYLGNVARIVAIIFAAQWGGAAWGERAHEVMGYGVFGIVLGGLLAAVGLMHRRWPEQGRATEPTFEGAAAIGPPAEVGEETPRAGAEAGAGTGGNTSPGGLGTAGAIALAVVLIAACVGEMSLLHRVANLPPRGGAGVALAADGRDPVELPAFIGTEWIGQRVGVSAVERDILPPDTGYSRKNYAFLGDRRRDVFLSIVLSGRDRTSIHRPELCLVGQGWTIEGSRRHAFQASAGTAGNSRFEATVLRVRREVPTPRGKVVTPHLVAYWFVASDTVVSSHWRRFLHDAWNRVVHGRVDRWAYVLMQTDASEGDAAALARMQAVLAGTLPAFQRPRS